MYRTIGKNVWKKCGSQSTDNHSIPISDDTPDSRELSQDGNGEWNTQTRDGQRDDLGQQKAGRKFRNYLTQPQIISLKPKNDPPGSVK